MVSVTLKSLSDPQLHSGSPLGCSDVAGLRRPRSCMVAYHEEGTSTDCKLSELTDLTTHYPYIGKMSIILLL